MPSLLVLRLIAAAAFLLAGGAKLAGAKPLAAQFKEFGLPAWTMRVVGGLEVAGAVGLFLGQLAFWAALGLTYLMLGAVANHLKARHPLSSSAPAFVLLVLCGLTAARLWSPEVLSPW